MVVNIELPLKAEILAGENLPDDFAQGALNIMLPLKLLSGEKVFWRRPKDIQEVAPVLKGLDFEYMQTGFIGGEGDGRYRLRSLVEQAEFANKCQSRGIEVAGVEFIDGVAIVRMVEGQPLSKYLKTPNSDLSVVNAFLESILKAHQNGTVLGDRWTKNALVRPNGSIIHIDFDIKLKGSEAREFEMAQAMYYVSLVNGGDGIKEVLARWQKDVLEKAYVYDLFKINKYLEAHQKLAKAYPQMNP